jgi:uncharacterized protein YggE
VNTVNRVHFRLQDEQKVRARALAEATRNARAHAEAMASAAGLTLGPIVLLEQHPQETIRPMMQEMAMARAADAAPTPIEPRMIDVRAAVTISIAIVSQR